MIILQFELFVQLYPGKLEFYITLLGYSSLSLELIFNQVKCFQRANVKGYLLSAFLWFERYWFVLIVRGFCYLLKFLDI